MPQDVNHHEFFKRRGLYVAAVVALGLLSLFLLAESVDVIQNLGRPDHAATDTITVSGSGQANLPPDVAQVSFTVQNKAATVAAAQKASTDQMSGALALVKKLGIADKDVKTTSYSIAPQYEIPPRPCPPGLWCTEGSRVPKVVGYEVSQTIQVTVRDLSMVGALLEGLGTRGVQNVSGPSFALDDPTAGYDAARADAIAKAKAQAALLSHQLGVSLGRIVSFTESSGTPYPISYRMSALSAVEGSTAPSTPVGENTYRASVTITYELR